MKKLLYILPLLFAQLAFAVSVNDVNISQVANANPVAYQNHTFTLQSPISTTLASYLSSIGLGTEDFPAFTGVTLSGLPSNGTDAANKTYVDSQLQNFDIKNPVVAATTGVLPFSPTYSNGSSGAGATLTGSVGVLVFDGYTPVLSDRLLIKNQASTFQNGVYTVTTVGTVGVGYVLTRSTDFNQTTSIIYGDTVAVLQGTVNANQQFTMNNQSAITVGTTAITFAQTSGGSQLTSGAGITITGNSVANTATTPIGTISAAAISDGGTWLACDGAVYAQSTYATLFARIGHCPQFNWAATPPSTFLQDGPSSITWDATNYIVSCNSGAIYTASTPSGSWTKRTSGVVVPLNGICAGNGVVVATGNTFTLITSTDHGVTWSTQSPTGISSVGNIFQPFYLNGVVFAATSNGYVVYSTDGGTTWTVTAQLNSSVNSNGIGIYVNGHWWSFTSGTANPAGFFWSANGSTWAYQVKPTTNPMSFVGADGTYVYVMDNTTGDVWRASTDPTTWTKSVSYSLLGNGSNFLSVFGYGTDRISALTGGISFYSLDGGNTWNPMVSRTPAGNGITRVDFGFPGSGQAINQLWGGAPSFWVFVNGITFYASVNGEDWFAYAGEPSRAGVRAANWTGASSMANQRQYWNGYYFFFTPSGTNTGLGGLLYATQPYDPSTNFQVPILKNADVTYRYIKAL